MVLTVNSLPDLPPAPTSHWILSLSGGGYKGIFTAHFLALLEKRIGQPLHQAFDLIAGTSIGSIVALGVSAGASADSLEGMLETKGPEIFPRRRRLLPMWLSAMIGPRYRQKSLRDALEKQFGSLTFGDMLAPTLLPAVSLGDASARIFRTPHAADFREDAELPIVEAALASSAAPFYFPPHRLGASQLADGSLIANAPHALAAVEAETVLRWPRDRVHMLAVGTTEVPTGTAFQSRLWSWGWPEWIKHKTLLTQMMASQQDLALKTARLMLHNRITVVDALRSADQDSLVGLDIANSRSTNILQNLAENAWKDFEIKHATVVTALSRHRSVPLKRF